MNVAHVYVEVDNAAPQSRERYAGYVLECVMQGKTVTRHDFARMSGTYHEAVLTMLWKAMKRFTRKCEVHIHTQDDYVLNMAARALPGWAKNGFRTSKGALVKNHFLWKMVWESSQGHALVPEHGLHSYYMWMQGEMAKKKQDPGAAER